jgi:hypothetical protein
MPPILYVLPGALAFGWWLATLHRLPDWRDAKFVLRPDRAFWAPWHILDRREWTPEGLKLRRQYVTHFCVSAALGLVGIAVVKHLER